MQRAISDQRRVEIAMATTPAAAIAANVSDIEWLFHSQTFMPAYPGMFLRRPWP